MSAYDPSDQHLFGQCGFDFYYDAGKIDGSWGGLLAVLPPSFEPDEPDEPDEPTGTTHERVDGLVVDAFPRSGWSCRRYVHLRGVTILADTSGYPRGVSAARACQLSDFLAHGVAFTEKHGGFAPLHLAHRTIETVDLCDALFVDDISDVLGSMRWHDWIASYRTYCEWTNAKLRLIVRSYVSQDKSLILGDRTSLHGHPLIASTYEHNAYNCEYSSPQGRIPVTRAEEFISFTAVVLGHPAVADACGAAEHAAGLLLERTGLP